MVERFKGSGIWDLEFGTWNLGLGILNLKLLPSFYEKIIPLPLLN
jgi:hypothetical protein